MNLSGGDMLMRALREEGVKFIFGYPGGAALHIYDSVFRQKSIEHILVRHEQGATHAADGYARATGKPGVVLVTSGPGATNAITGIATAFMDSIPMIVISGQVQSHLIGTDSFQETDMIGISRPIVKHSYIIQDVRDIPKVVQEAFHIATSGRPGPVVIDIPKDMTDPSKKFKYQKPANPDIRSYKPKSLPHPGQIKKAAKAILSSERPVIYSGGGVIIGNASKELNDLNKLLKVPLTSTLMGLGAFPANNKLFLGMLGMHGTYQANMSMHNADLILAVGARFYYRITNTLFARCTLNEDVTLEQVAAQERKNVAKMKDAGFQGLAIAYHVPYMGFTGAEDFDFVMNYYWYSFDARAHAAQNYGAFVAENPDVQESMDALVSCEGTRSFVFETMFNNLPETDS